MIGKFLGDKSTMRRTGWFDEECEAIKSKNGTKLKISHPDCMEARKEDNNKRIKEMQ